MFLRRFLQDRPASLRHGAGALRPFLYVSILIPVVLFSGTTQGKTPAPGAQVKKSSSGPQGGNRDSIPGRGFFSPVLVGGPRGVEVVLVKRGGDPARLQVRGPGRTLREKDAGKGSLLRVALPVLPGRGPYSYRFTWKGGGTPWYSFRPLPEKKARRVRLAVYGDSRSNPKVHRALALLMAARKPDLVLNTGDLVGLGPVWSQWERSYLEPLAPLGSHVPIFTVIGNHEGEAPAYFKLCTRSGPKRAWWSADVGPLHLVGLDSNLPLGPGSPQRRWLEKDLAQAAPKPVWKILLLHHPFFTACPGRKPVAKVRELLPLIVSRGVSLVLEGHDHHYMRTFPVVLRLRDSPSPGLVCITTGGGGAHLYPVRRMPFTAKGVETWHYLSIDAGPDRLSGEAFDWKGKLIDSWVMTRKGGAPGPRFWLGSEALAQAGKAMLDGVGPLFLDKDFRREISLPLVLPSRLLPPPGMRLLLAEGRGWTLSQAGKALPGKTWKWVLRFSGSGLPGEGAWPSLLLDLGTAGIAGRIQHLGALPLWRPPGPWLLKGAGIGAPGKIALVDREGKKEVPGLLAAGLQGGRLQVRFFSPLGKKKTSKPRAARLAQWAKGTRTECLVLHLCGPGGKRLQSFHVTRSYRRFQTGWSEEDALPGKGWKVRVLPGARGKGWGAEWEISLKERWLPLPGSGLMFQVSHFLAAEGIAVSSGPLKSDLVPWPRTMRLLAPPKPE